MPTSGAWMSVSIEVAMVWAGSLIGEELVSRSCGFERKETAETAFI